MQDYTRYGVYYAPPSGSALARFGAAWLGWDAEAGAEVPHPHADGLDVAALTAMPRKYGFHGTLKPPFRLAGGTDAEELDRALARLAGRTAGFDAPAPALNRIGPFIALVPSAPCPELAGLAASCVRELDRFRAPPDAAELAKRRRAGLSPAQEANLARWGYPYVMDEFRFHLSLTGPLADDAAEAALAVLARLTAPFCTAPLPVRDLCIFAEHRDGRLQLIRRHPLAG